MRSLPLAPPELQILVREGADSGVRTLVVAVRGELDIATTTQLRSCLDNLVRAGHVRLRLELADLAFCDVAGLSILLQVARQLRAAGGELVLDDAPRSLARIVGALQLEPAFRMRHERMN